MPLTVNQTAAFFSNDDQMGIPQETVAALANEGITIVDDLVDFDKDSIGQVAENLRKPGDRIPNPDPQAPPGSTIPRPPYVFGAKSQKRLLAACEAVRYYETTNRPLTVGNMNWDPVVRNHSEQWKALVARKDEDIEVPKVTKQLPILKWVEAFYDFLHRKVGVRSIPLAYVTRDHVQVPIVAPPLLPNRPHSEEHGSVEGELIARASHDHPLYRDDNAQVYYHVEEALRSTVYAPSIKPFQRRKDGRGALASVVDQYAGKDKWEAELKAQDNFLHTRKWTGTSNFALEKFVSQHRNAFVSMTQCAQHITFQLPDEGTRVTYLLDAIQNKDPHLMAAIALVKNDEGTQAAPGKRKNFEAAASFIIPNCPVARQRQDNINTKAVNVASTVGVGKQGEGGQAVAQPKAQVNAFGSKQGVGKTGVHFRYYNNKEYQRLTHEQKKELAEYRKNNNGTPGQNSVPRDNTANISAAVSREVNKQMKSFKRKHEEAEGARDDAKAMEEYILSVVDNRSGSPSKKTRIDESRNTSHGDSMSGQTKLQSILHRLGKREK